MLRVAVLVNVSDNRNTWPKCVTLFPSTAETLTDGSVGYLFDKIGVNYAPGTSEDR
jgi:hypothetical protein